MSVRRICTSFWCKLQVLYFKNTYNLHKLVAQLHKQYLVLEYQCIEFARVFGANCKFSISSIHTICTSLWHNFSNSNTKILVHRICTSFWCKLQIPYFKNTYNFHKLVAQLPKQYQNTSTQNLHKLMVQTTSSLFQEYIQFTQVSGTTSHLVLDYHYMKFVQLVAQLFIQYRSRGIKLGGI